MHFALCILRLQNVLFFPESPTENTSSSRVMPCSTTAVVSGYTNASLVGESPSSAFPFPPQTLSVHVRRHAFSNYFCQCCWGLFINAVERPGSASRTEFKNAHDFIGAFRTVSYYKIV